MLKLGASLLSFVFSVSCEPLPVTSSEKLSIEKSPPGSSQPQVLDCQTIATTMTTQECKMVEETCSVVGVKEFPPKTYACGYGKLHYQKFLCDTFPSAMNSSTLESVTCDTKTLVEDTSPTKQSLSSGSSSTKPEQSSLELCQKLGGSFQDVSCHIQIADIILLIFPIERMEQIGCDDSAGEGGACLSQIEKFVLVVNLQDSKVARLEHVDGDDIYKTVLRNWPSSKGQRPSFDNLLLKTTYREISVPGLEKALNNGKVDICFDANLLVSSHGESLDQFLYAPRNVSQSTVITNTGLIGTGSNMYSCLPVAFQELIKNSDFSKSKIVDR